jgi:signal transduction histidine kinase
MSARRKAAPRRIEWMNSLRVLSLSKAVVLVRPAPLVRRILPVVAPSRLCRKSCRASGNLICLVLPFHLLPLKLFATHVTCFASLRPKTGLLLVVICLAAMGAVASYWLGYFLLRVRLHRLAEAMHSFVTSGFRMQIATGTGREGVSIPLRTVLDPAREVEALTSNADLMASAIKDSKRRMMDRERNHLDWLAFLCHDLAAPLVRVLSRIEALEHGTDLTADQRMRALESARTEIAQSVDLIGSVSYFAQLESETEREFETVTLDPILEQVVSVFEFEASQKAIELDLRIRPDVGRVAIQKTLIRRAVENLISNAMRFTPQGGLISVLLERSGEMAQISVTDTGTGIPDDELARIFEFEFRGEKQTCPSTIGSKGLGLALVKKVAEIHHGEVTAHNVEPHGAEFVISLPIVIPNADV